MRTIAIPSVSAMLLLLAAALQACTIDTTTSAPADANDTQSDSDGAPASTVDCDDLATRDDDATTFYETNPTYTDPHDDSASWIVASPAEVGVDETLLSAAARAFEVEPFALSLLVVKNGVLISENYFHGSKRSDSNNVHSASKSILGVLVGLAVEADMIAGLDTRIDALLPETFASVTDATKRSITVRHLLSMTSGLQWTEDSTEYELETANDWISAIVDLPMADSPGSRFNYSTGNTHLLSAALSSAIGRSTCQFAHDRLFGPLGIRAEHWGRDPSGVFSGGFNLYLTPRELLKFGQLILQRGTWNGEQLVPASWIDASLSHQVDAGDGYSYGHLFWLRRIGGHDVAIAWGYGGQFAYVIPSLDAVIVMTSSTQEGSPTANVEDVFDGEHIIEEFVIPAMSAPAF